MEQKALIQQFWNKFIETIQPGVERPETYQSWAFGRTSETADKLASLVMDGLKTATAGLVWNFEAEIEPFPQVGQYNLILNGKGEPVCIIQTTSVEVKPFNAVDDRHAMEEGEGDLSLAFWREVHWRVFSEECADIGLSPDVEMPVCCERFRLCYPLDSLSQAGE
jgi:uncharacterized protein YhfF